MWLSTSRKWLARYGEELGDVLWLNEYEKLWRECAEESPIMKSDNESERKFKSDIGRLSIIVTFIGSLGLGSAKQKQ
jgi:hypothetical protein